MEVHRLCRLCLTYSHYYSNIFIDKVTDKHVYRLVNSICELNAFRNDGLPEYICVDCMETVTKTCTFINQAKESQSALKLLNEKNRSKVSTETCNLSPTDNNKEPDRRIFTEVSPSRNCTQNSPAKTVGEEGEEVLQILSEVPGILNQDESLKERNTIGEGKLSTENNPECPGKKNRGRKEGTSLERKTGNSASKKVDEENKVESCKKCKKEFRGKVNLQRHATLTKHFPVQGNSKTKKHNSSISYQCSMCPVWITRKEHLDRHMRRVHKVKFSCEMCGLDFNTESALQRHMEAHMGLRPYICHKCNFRFKDASGLAKHRGCIKAQDTSGEPLRGVESV